MKTGLLPVIFVTVAVLATGCAGPTSAQRESARIDSIGAPARARLDACLSAVTESAEFAPLRPHMPPQISRVSIEQLNSPDFPTEEEKALLVRRLDSVNRCTQEFIGAIQGVVPSIASIYAQGDDAYRIFLADFLKGGQTWGDYNRRRFALAQAEEADLSAEANNLRRQFEASHYAETSARGEAAATGLRAVGAGLAGYSASRQYNTIQPNNITCRPFGSGITCNRW